MKALSMYISVFSSHLCGELSCDKVSTGGEAKPDATMLVPGSTLPKARHPYYNADNLSSYLS